VISQPHKQNTKENEQKTHRLMGNYSFLSSVKLQNQDLSPQQDFHQCFLYILLPQTIYQWVQHGDHCGIENRGYFLLVQGVTRRQFEIYEGDRPKEYPHSHEMRAASSKSFGPAL
jgi:hypothetical protein